MEPGEAIPATFTVGDREFRGTFTGQEIAGFGGATVPVDNADFIYGVANHESLTITCGDGPPGDRPARGRRRGDRRPADLPGRPVARTRRRRGCAAPAPSLAPRGGGA